MNYMGIDHHKQYSHTTLLDEKGEKINSKCCGVNVVPWLIEVVEDKQEKKFLNPMNIVHF